MILNNKLTVKQNYLVRKNIDSCVDRKELRKDSKVGAARRDQTVCRGAPVCDEVAIYTFTHACHGLSRIYMRTRRAVRFKVFEMMVYFLQNWTVLDALPLKHRIVRLIGAAPMDASLFKKKMTCPKKKKAIAKDPFSPEITNTEKNT